MATVKAGDLIKLHILKVENAGCVWARQLDGEQGKEQMKKNEQLQADIKDYFNNNCTQKVPVVNPVLHQVYIGRGTTDRVWYRVRVEDRVGISRMYWCFLVDEGTQNVFKEEWLRLVPAEFINVPYQAQCYQLGGVKPLSLATTSEIDLTVTKQPSRCWDSAATSLVKKSLKAQPLTEAEVMRVEKDQIYVRLYIGPERICINDQLIEKKYGYRPQDENTQEGATHSNASTENIMSQSDEKFEAKTIKSRSPTPTPPLAASVAPTQVASARAPTLVPAQPESLPTSVPNVPVQPVAPSMPVEPLLKSFGRGLLRTTQLLGGTPLRPNASGEPGQQIPNLEPSGLTIADSNLGNINSDSRTLPGALETRPGAKQPGVAHRGRGIGRGHLMSILTNEFKSPAAGVKKSVEPDEDSGPPPLESTLGEEDNIPIIETSYKDTRQLGRDFDKTNSISQETQPTNTHGLVDSLKEISLKEPPAMIEANELNVFPRSEMDTRLTDSDSDHKLQSCLSTIAPPSSMVSQCPANKAEEEDSRNLQVKQTSKPEHRITEDSLKLRNKDVTIESLTEVPLQLDVNQMEQAESHESSIERCDLWGVQKGPLEQLLRITDDSASDTEQQYSFYTDLETPSADKLGVLLDGEVQPTFILNTKMMFDSTMNAVINRLDLMPTNIQSYCWPALLRLRNVLGISSAYRHVPSQGGGVFRQGGTTFTYLIPLIANLRLKSSYAGVPAGVGPLSLVLCSGSWRVNQVFEQVRKVCGEDIFLKVIKLYGGMGTEQHLQETRMCNGCDLLITTPRCLLRMLTRDQPIIELTRVCHLVLEDGDKLIEYQNEEVNDIFTRYEDCIDIDEERSTPRQVVMMGKHWTPNMLAFMKSHMPDVTVVIASMSQGAIYCGVEKIIRIVRADQRLSLLSELLVSVKLKKTIVFTNSPATALAVHESLTQFSVSAILCHEGLPLSAINEARNAWIAPYSPGSAHVLVLTDDMLAENWVHDAELAVHYDLPTEKHYFGNRLWCMFENFKCSLNPSPKAKGATSILYVTEKWKPYISLLIMDLRHSDLPIPPALQTLADELVMEKEKQKYTPLCRLFKAFGRCSLSHSCSARHCVVKHLDSPGSHKMHQVLPTSGQVKVLVTYVEDATRLWVRLLEHETPNGTKDLRVSNLILATNLAMHYSNEKNQIPCGYPNVGQLYIIKDTMHVYKRVEVVTIKYRYNTKVIERVGIRLVDLGDTLWVDPWRLLQLDADFSSVPFQAIEVYICGVKPIDKDTDWTSRAQTLVWEHANGQELDGRIVLALGNTMWVNPLVKRELLKNIGTVTHSVVVHRLLLDNDLAVPNPEHMPLLYKACINNVDMPDVLNLSKVPHMAYDILGMPTTLKMQEVPKTSFEFLRVQITAVLHPDLFYARLLENVDKLNELHIDIQNYLKVHKFTDQVIELIKPGSLVLATSPQDDPKEDPRLWYRAKVQAIVEDKYDVFYLDTGESEFVAPTEIKPMPMYLTRWPFQAMECRLAYLKPPEGEEWDEEKVGDALWGMVSYSVDSSHIPLNAKVVSSSERALNIGSTKYTLRLFNRNQEFVINIGQELVAQGYAQPTLELIQANMPPVDESSQAVYKNMPTLCTQLILSSEKKQIEKIDRIQKLIRSQQHDVEGICRCRVVGVLFVTLGFLHLNETNVGIGELLCKCLVLLTKLSVSVFDAILDDDGVTTLCQMLARENTMGYAIVTSTIASFVKHEQLREPFVNSGVLRLLAPLLYTTEAEDEQTLKHALIAMYELVQALGERHRVAVIRSGCVPALCHQVEHSQNTDHLITALQTLRIIFMKVRIQEESRRWAAPTLCKRLKTANPRIIEHILLALTSFARGSRINKDALLEYDIIDLIKDASVNTPSEARSESLDLHASLSALRPNTDYEEIVTPNFKNSATPEKTDRNTGLDDYTNIPIPRENLFLVKQTIPPPVKWFQDRWNLVLFVEVKNVTENSLIEIQRSLVKFRALVEQIEYVLELALYEEIIPEKCETKITPGHVRIGLRKVSHGTWPRIIKGRNKLPYLRPDFERYIEESDTDSDDLNSTQERHNESPLAIIERCKPRPLGMPAPTTEYTSPVQPGLFEPVDPTDDHNYKAPPSDDDKSDDYVIVDEHDADLDRQYYNM